jgi:hypothetical protein
MKDTRKRGKIRLHEFDIIKYIMEKMKMNHLSHQKYQIVYHQSK